MNTKIDWRLMNQGQLFYPKKKFSQNFLESQSFLNMIAQSLQIKPSDCIVEIGPGTGNLTSHLITKSNELHLIEVDEDMIKLLKLRFKHNDLNIYHQDILKFDFQKKFKNKKKTIKIISNLPYHLTSPILFHLYHQKVAKEMVLMMQKEVAMRICAKINHKNYSRLTVMSHFYADIESLFDVPASAFWPSPKIDSTVLRFSLKEQLINDISSFEKFIKLCFSQKRKKISNNLKSVLNPEQFNQLISTSDLDFNHRAESISLNQYLELFKIYQGVKNK